MRGAIVAAGVGDRLRAAGISDPKPLVRVGGRLLIDHALGSLDEAGIRRVACIVNEESEGIEAHCAGAWPSLSIDFIRRTTPSSMESLFALAPLLSDVERFVLVTVDSVAAPGTLRDFVGASERRAGADVVLAVTDFVDDEKPLWVAADAEGRVLQLGNSVMEKALVTAGYYVMSPRIFGEVEAARRAGYAALRRFLAHLLERGYRIEVERVGPVVDVDRPEDIATAEVFLRSSGAQ